MTKQTKTSEEIAAEKTAKELATLTAAEKAVRAKNQSPDQKKAEEIMA